MDQNLGIGRLANYQSSQADTAACAADISWGAAVQLDANGKAIPFAANGVFYGVALANHFDYNDDNFITDKVGLYKTNDAVSVLRKGTIVVHVEEDVKLGDAAVADNATANFRPSTTATVGISPVIGTFKSTTAAGGLAELQINLP